MTTDEKKESNLKKPIFTLKTSGGTTYEVCTETSMYRRFGQLKVADPPWSRYESISFELGNPIVFVKRNIDNMPVKYRTHGVVVRIHEGFVH